jgi:thiol-disulfide isomerase/thioredoxin
MRFIVFLAWLTGLGSYYADAQRTIPVLDFPTFEKRINTPGDRIMVYNFWATWCKPCVEELPFFQAIPTEVDGIPVEVVFVSLDFASQLDSRVVPFVEKRNMQQEVILLNAGNPNIWIDKIDSSWSGAIPATLFRYKDTRRFEERSYETTDDIVQHIRSLIKN